MLSCCGPELLVGVLIATPTEVRAAVLDYRGQIRTRHHEMIDTSSERTVHRSLRACLDVAVSQMNVALTALDELIVGLPGAIRPDSQRPALTPAPDNTAGWNGLAPWLSTALVDQLVADLPRQPLIENDANLAAMAEHEFGAGRPYHDTIYLKLTAAGIGCGLVINNRLQRGATGFAGELAHTHVHSDGPLCHCGGRGCLATILGQDMFRALEPGNDRPDRARAIDAIAATLGRSLSPLCTLLNPPPSSSTPASASTAHEFATGSPTASAPQPHPSPSRTCTSSRVDWTTPRSSAARRWPGAQADGSNGEHARREGTGRTGHVPAMRLRFAR